MCILALAWQVLDQHPVLMISNRDEFYQRPTQALHVWQDQKIYAGKDLQNDGTWMGVTAQGRWAILTNVREGDDQKNHVISRGRLITDFLTSDETPIRFLQQIEQQQTQYAGFNLIVGDLVQAAYMSNRGEMPQVLAKGVYVISNGLMGQHWEKTAHLRQRFTQELLPLQQALIESLSDIEQEHCVNIAWDILEDERKVADDLLPHTGISEQMEKMLSSIFIQSASYGTRCSNYLLISEQNIFWIEKIQAGERQGQQMRMEIDLK